LKHIFFLFLLSINVSSRLALAQIGRVLNFCGSKELVQAGVKRQDYRQSSENENLVHAKHETLAHCTLIFAQAYNAISFHNDETIKKNQQHKYCIA
jgi:hypothetical protein